MSDRRDVTVGWSDWLHLSSWNCIQLFANTASVLPPPQQALQPPVVTSEGSAVNSMGVNAMARRLQGLQRQRLSAFRHMFVSTVPPVVEERQYEKPNTAQVMIDAVLKRNFLFRNFSASELRGISERMFWIDVPATRPLFSAGDPSDYFFIITRGEIEVVTEVAPSVSRARGSSKWTSQTVEPKREGDCVSELALLFEHKSRATAIASKATTVYALHRNDYRFATMGLGMSAESDRMEFMHSVTMFSHLPIHQLRTLSASMSVVVVPPGEAIQLEGDQEKNLDVVRWGSVVENLAATGESGIRGRATVVGRDTVIQRTGSIAAKSVFSGPTGCALLRFSPTNFAQEFPEVFASLAKSFRANATANILGAIPLLKAVSPSDLAKVAEKVVEKMTMQTWEDGSVIARQGEKDRAFGIIQEGTVEIIVSTPSSEMLVAQLLPGQYFGELVLLLEELPRDCSVVAKGRVTCAWLSRSAFAELTALGPSATGASTDSAVTRKLRHETLLASVTSGVPKESQDVCEIEHLDDLVHESREPKESLDIRDLDDVAILRHGNHGFISLARQRRSSRALFAIWHIRKQDAATDASIHLGLRNWRDIARTLPPHPFILPVLATTSTESYICFVTPHSSRGDLASKMAAMGTPFDSESARLYASMIVLALSFLHRHNVVFRDLRLENVFIGHDGYAALGTFRSATVTPAKTFTVAGTVEYMAPEVLIGTGHSLPADMWSLGVLIHEMLVGSTPFNPEHDLQLPQIVARIVESEQVDFSASSSPGWTDGARLLVSDLLQRNPDSRPSAVALRSHPWFEGIDFLGLRKKEVAPPWMPDPSEESLPSDHPPSWPVAPRWEGDPSLFKDW